jgi:GDP-L-fucose synthase
VIKDEILTNFSGKNVLVTGGTGMIGSEVARILCDAGSKVKIVSLDNIVVDERAEHIKADLTNISVCKDVTSGMDYVFHIAGIKGSIEVTKSKPASFLVPLLMFNANVLEASRANGVKKLVYTSSIGAYSSAEVFKEEQNLDGAPMDMYPGWAKRMAELQIKAYREQYGLDWAVVRPCNVYGPRDNFDPDNAMVIPSLMMRINRGENPVVVWGDGSAVRDFAFSRDVAEGIILAIYHGTRGDFVNLGSGVGMTIKELVETLHRFLDFNYEFDTTKPSGFPKRVMDISRARKWIDYNPTTTLLDGLKETWLWFQKNQKEYLKRKNYFAEE